jgi:hypothetical protein
MRNDDNCFVHSVVFSLGEKEKEGQPYPTNPCRSKHYVTTPGSWSYVARNTQAMCVMQDAWSID